MNVKFNQYMFRGVKRSQIGTLAVRVLLGLLFLVCMYTSAKSLPLVYVALCQNLSPLLTAVFSYVYLKKGLTRLDIGVLVVSFFGVALLITGTIQD